MVLSSAIRNLLNCKHFLVISQGPQPPAHRAYTPAFRVKHIGEIKVMSNGFIFQQSGGIVGSGPQAGEQILMITNFRMYRQQSYRVILQLTTYLILIPNPDPLEN
jgi:hypothetical protein